MNAREFAEKNEAHKKHLRDRPEWKSNPIAGANPVWAEISDDGCLHITKDGEMAPCDVVRFVKWLKFQFELGDQN
jgi:hypothetical protein